MNKITIQAIGDRGIRIERWFAANPESVFAAMTDPELLPRWLTGPPGWSMTECQVDRVAGGSYRFAWKGPTGESMALFGKHLGFETNVRVVNTEAMELDGQVLPGEREATLTVAPEKSGTALTLVLEFIDANARDATLQSGLEQGMAMSYANLDAFLGQRSV